MLSAGEMPVDLEWLEPWVPTDELAQDLERELSRELSQTHRLYGIPVMAVACRIDRDDVLFATGDPTKPLAVVHLTWSGSPNWSPSTMYYGSWQDSIDRAMIPDHADYAEPFEW